MIESNLKKYIQVLYKMSIYKYKFIIFLILIKYLERLIFYYIIILYN